ncbi:major outer membrane protein [Helicobacter sp. MIT 11-5569]|uniref:major outer membrane protein n=1 Tax=Helicobacter sp. MIT 11-5569 TaxID=1548151 RepID=UPI00051FDFAC|nr:major outer membrane protein [Helicobacter sp. MIT 11-5569]TLD84043.1 major outer membrane protein [Helicobacter sp. MIT 11-5569]
MKFLKLSLAASVALGAFSTASFAQPLEEAIKGVDVSGFLRYRYNDDRYDNQNNVDNDAGPTPAAKGNATHRWRAQADFKTPTVNAVALNLGVYYNNERQNVNHGKNGAVTDANGNTVLPAGLGNGLGAGKDGDFGVSVYNATITPDSTATTVILGKQRLGTPLTDALDDRGTGILALNSDIPGLTLAAGAFDSWSLDDMFQGYNGNETSVDKPLYVLAAIYNTDTAIGNFGAQVWGFYVDSLVDSAIFAELGWKYSFLNATLQYAMLTLNDDAESLTAGLYGKINPNDPNSAANAATDNDLLSFQIGANFKEYNLPLDIKLGYITNFQDGIAVSFDDEGTFAKAGKLWWQNNATGVSIGLGATLLNGNYQAKAGDEQEISVMYGTLGYGFLEDRLNIGIEGVFGENEVTRLPAGQTDGGVIYKKTKFTEITPVVSWQHNKNLKISAFYAMLSTELETENGVASSKPDEDRNRARVEVKYSF